MGEGAFWRTPRRHPRARRATPLPSRPQADNLKDVASRVDVLYQTRIQKERFQDRPEDYEAARGKYVVDAAVMDALPATSVVMHPLPRVDEITPDVDTDPRAAYFRQAKNGLYVRMALLKLALAG